MKGQFKGFSVGLLVGAFILSGIVAVASDGLRTLENVKVGGIRIVIDGNEFTCTDANGVVVEPMIYNGTTYIPVRAVSTAFGKAVYWDGEESTVYLGKMDGKLEKPTAKFENLTNIAGARTIFRIEKNISDPDSVFYNYAYYAVGGYYGYDPDDCCEYLLDGKYSRFKATVFVEEGANWKGTTSLKIIGDEEVLYNSDSEVEGGITKTTDAFNIDIDITGVDNFKIIFSDTGKLFITHEGFYQ